MFGNLPSNSWIVYLILYPVCILGFIGVNLYLQQKSRNSSGFKHQKKDLLFFSVMGGIGLAMSLSVIVCTLMPTVVVVDENLEPVEKFSFIENGRFVGLGGCYIVNNSSMNLRLVGIDNDRDLSENINAGEIVEVKKKPQEYFTEVPEHQSKWIRYTRKGRKRTVSGHTLFLVEK